VGRLSKSEGTVAVRYKKLTAISQIETFARGVGVDVRHDLNTAYGRGNWRKRKGIATIEYENGTIWRADLHWYEASNIGRRREKVKKDLERIA
jgi:hypothetical protein